MSNDNNDVDGVMGVEVTNDQTELDYSTYFFKVNIDEFLFF